MYLRILLISHIILSIVSSSLFAQNKQVTLWKVFDHVFDFTTNPPSVRPLPYSSDLVSYGGWYVDSKGEVVLDSRSDGLLGKDGNMIIEGYTDFSLFVPAPNEERFVYCLSDFVIYKVDIQEGVVVEKYSFPLGSRFVAVHSFNCDNIWLVSKSDNQKVMVYSITDEGVALNREIVLNPEDYRPNVYNSEPYWNFNLSMDCKEYTFSSTESTTTYYGSFDRSDASFLRKSSYTFSDCSYISNSLISPDKSRIYYLLFRGEEWKVDFVEVRIVGGIPDYSTFRVFHTLCDEVNELGLFYGPDGKVYSMGYHSGIYGTIEIENDEAVYKDFVKYPTYWTFTHNTMASWYLPKPCGETATEPCPEIKPPVILWNRE